MLSAQPKRLTLIGQECEAHANSHKVLIWSTQLCFTLPNVTL